MGNQGDARQLSGGCVVKAKTFCENPNPRIMRRAMFLADLLETFAALGIILAALCAVHFFG